jgi:hypothetical protein
VYLGCLENKAVLRAAGRAYCADLGQADLRQIDLAKNADFSVACVVDNVTELNWM